MNGPAVILLVVLLALPVFLLILWVDTRLTEREYQRRIGGDESERYERARRAVARQTRSGNVRIGHKETREER